MIANSAPDIRLNIFLDEFDSSKDIYHDTENKSIDFISIKSKR